MLTTVIRKEHKNRWEKRTALVPECAAQLVKAGYPISVEPSDIRIYDDESYKKCGVPTNGCPDNGQFIVGIKEPPVESIKTGQVHLAFSHTIKGQDYNMGLLQRFIDQKATLIDYEPIIDESGERTIAFGRFAGIAGAIDSFMVAGQKAMLAGETSCLSHIKQTWQYPSIDQIKTEFKQLDVAQSHPFKVLIVGTGKVGKGAQEVCHWLGLPQVPVEDLLAGNEPQGSWYAVASSRHINERIDGKPFDMNDFIKYGKKKYKSTFDRLLGKFDILLQTPYWTEKYPKHLDRNRMIAMQDKLPRVVGDISCDINGSLECTLKASDIDTPAFTYDVHSHSFKDGVQLSGISVMSIDNLPCELSLDASEHFSNVLRGYMQNLMSMKLDRPFAECGLIPELAGAVIVYNGELTPNFQYLQKFLDAVNT